MLAGQATVCHGWKPESGFLPFHWKGYDEALIVYVLALGSPTHPIGAESYDAWTETYEWRSVEGIESLHASSLFIHQMSHAWIDFRGLQDDFMRAHDSDYFRNSGQATRIQQRYAMRNPGNFEEYGEFSFGLSASDGPGRRNPTPAGSVRTYFDYVARGVPDGPDDGTLAPWAVVASLPFAPDIVLPALENFVRLQLHLDNPYGFKASFNATYPADNNHPIGWVSPFHFGIDVGPIVIMIDNYRSGLVWRLCRNIPVIKQGLKIAGFRGGWLDNS
ncbi:MAG: glucoamylase family protein [Pseudomonadota bacterium]